MAGTAGVSGMAAGLGGLDGLAGRSGAAVTGLGTLSESGSGRARAGGNSGSGGVESSPDAEGTDGLAGFLPASGAFGFQSLLRLASAASLSLARG